jgi:hypothetical protein
VRTRVSWLVRLPPVVGVRRGAPGSGWRRLVLQVVGATCLPALMLAQGGMGGGGMGGGGMGGGRGSTGSPSIRNTLDPHMAVLIRADNPDDPTALVIAARTDLKLSDSEVTAIYSVRTMMLASQAPARSALDTLGPNPPLSSIDFAHITSAGRDSLIAHRKAVAAANGQIHDASIVARQQMVALLTPAQQKQLTDLQQHVQQERNTPHDSADADDSHGGGRKH